MVTAAAPPAWHQFLPVGLCEKFYLLAWNQLLFKVLASPLASHEDRHCASFHSETLLGTVCSSLHTCSIQDTLGWREARNTCCRSGTVSVQSLPQIGVGNQIFLCVLSSSIWNLCAQAVNGRFWRVAYSAL
jgi:hypothetical protein